MMSLSDNIIVVYVLNSGPSPPVGKVQPTKQNIPTIPNNMTGIKMINDALIIPPHCQHR